MTEVAPLQAVAMPVCEPPRNGCETSAAYYAKDSLNNHKVIFRGALNLNYIKNAYGMCTGNCFCVDKVKARAYTHIHENRFESNIPFLPGCCCCFANLCTVDMVKVTYFDKGITPEFERVNNCTPYHACCFFENCGGVVANAPKELCIKARCLPCCGCFVNYFGGLDNADEFAAAAEIAVKTFRARMIAGGNGPSSAVMTMQG
jgi:hypothetical protein